MKTIITDQITKYDVFNWIKRSKDLHALKSIKAKAKKRIIYLENPPDDNPLKNIPIEKKKEILKDLFVDNENGGVVEDEDSKQSIR